MGNNKSKQNQKYSKINKNGAKMINSKSNCIQQFQKLNEVYHKIIEQFEGICTQQIKNNQNQQEQSIEDQDIIQTPLKQLFEMGYENSLSYIFIEQKTSENKDDISQIDTQILQIYNNIYSLQNLQVDNDQFKQFLQIKENQKMNIRQKQREEDLYKRETKLKQKLREKFRENVIQLIENKNSFVIQKIINRFNQIMNETYMKDLNQKQKYLNKQNQQMKKVDAEFIFHSFRIVINALQKIIEQLLEKKIEKIIPNKFQNCPLYQSIFSGKIIEKLFLKNDNKDLFLAAIEVLFNETNKELNLKFGNKELVYLEFRNQEFVQIFGYFAFKRDKTEKQTNQEQTQDQTKIDITNLEQNIKLVYSVYQECKEDGIYYESESFCDGENKSVCIVEYEKDKINDIFQNGDSQNNSQINNHTDTLRQSYMSSDLQQKRKKINQSINRDLLQQEKKQYLFELQSSIEDCLQEKQLFKISEMVIDISLKIKDLYIRYSENQEQSEKFMTEPENQFYMILMILSSFLKVNPHYHKNFFILYQIINLLPIDDRNDQQISPFETSLEIILQISGVQNLNFSEITTNKSSLIKQTSLILSENQNDSFNIKHSEEFQSQIPNINQSSFLQNQ